MSQPPYPIPEVSALARGPQRTSEPAAPLLLDACVVALRAFKMPRRLATAVALGLGYPQRQRHRNSRIRFAADVKEKPTRFLQTSRRRGF